MSTPPSPDARAYALATVRVLAGRDITRMVRQPARVAWALVPGLLVWAVLGVGLQGSFRLAEAAALTALQVLFPGALVLTLGLGALLATEEGEDAFLPWVLAGPGSRLAVVAGRVLGASLRALLPGLLFLLLAPLAGVTLAAVSLPLLAVGLGLTALALAAGGVALSGWGTSPSRTRPWVGGGVLLLWALSGALFPPRGAGPVLRVLVAANPLHFAVEALQRALHGEAAAVALGGAASLWGTLGGLVALVAGLITLAVVGSSRRT